jgi:hypothetical protein
MSEVHVVVKVLTCVPALNSPLMVIAFLDTAYLAKRNASCKY